MTDEIYDTSKFGMASIILANISSKIAIIASFFLMDWWIPLCAFVAGYWVIPGMLVAPETASATLGVKTLLSAITVAISGFIIFSALRQEGII